MVTTTSTLVLRSAFLRSTFQTFEWPPFLEEGRLGQEQVGLADVEALVRLVGQEVDRGDQFGKEVFVGVDDLDLHLDGSPGPVAGRDDLAEPPR